jgi:hypothetical protein
MVRRLAPQRLCPKALPSQSALAVSTSPPRALVYLARLLQLTLSLRLRVSPVLLSLAPLVLSLLPRLLQLRALLPLARLPRLVPRFRLLSLA